MDFFFNCHPTESIKDNPIDINYFILICVCVCTLYISLVFFPYMWRPKFVVASFKSIKSLKTHWLTNCNWKTKYSYNLGSARNTNISVFIIENTFFHLSYNSLPNLSGFQPNASYILFLAFATLNFGFPPNIDAYYSIFHAAVNLNRTKTF